MPKIQPYGWTSDIHDFLNRKLKELYGSINKKNWGQLLKGKLIDLGIAQIINQDTMKLVYEFVTNDILRIT